MVGKQNVGTQIVDAANREIPNIKHKITSLSLNW